jgi:hypothetical protein
VTGHRPVLDLGRALADRDHPWDPATALAFAPSWFPQGAAGAQVRGQFSFEAAARLDVQRLVDGLGRHPHVSFVGDVELESASDAQGCRDA